MERKFNPFNVVSYMVALSNERVGDFPTGVLGFSNALVGMRYWTLWCTGQQKGRMQCAPTIRMTESNWCVGKLCG